MEKSGIFNLLTNIRRGAGWLVNLEIWLVTPMIAASFIWPGLLPAAVIFAAVFVSLRWIAENHPTRCTPVDGAVLLLIVMVFITLWVTAVPEKTVPQAFRLLSGIAIFYAIVNWVNQPKRLRLLILGIGLAGFFLALFAMISVEWPLDKLPFISKQLYERFVIVVSDTVNPSVMAGSLVLLLPIPFAGVLLNWNGMRWTERILLSVATIAMLVIVALSLSRGAWIALGAILLIMVVLGWRWGWLMLIPISVLALLIVIRTGIPQLLELAFSSGVISNWDGRKEIWSRAIYMIRDFPFSGVGMGSLTEVADALYPFFSYPPGTVQHAHNLFLQIAVDLGIPGLVAWLLIIITVIALTWRLYRHGLINKNPYCKSLGVGLLCSQLALVVHGMTDAVTWGMVRPAPFVWIVWGVIVAGWNVLVKDHAGDG